ncbi:MAG: VanZ family protein [Desulfobacterales bacterium]|nr:VanZ family protein [Desulfobacterales bacterium]
MNRLLIYIETYWMAFTLFMLAVITALSLWPLEFLPSAPGSDKTHHIIAYAALMIPTAIRKPQYWKLIGLFFIAYSGVIELLQPHVNRYGEWQDMAANTAGVVCGLLVAELVIYFFSANSKYPR